MNRKTTTAAARPPIFPTSQEGMEKLVAGIIKKMLSRPNAGVDAYLHFFMEMNLFEYFDEYIEEYVADRLCEMLDAYMREYMEDALCEELGGYIDEYVDLQMEEHLKEHLHKHIIEYFDESPKKGCGKKTGKGKPKRLSKDNENDGIDNNGWDEKFMGGLP